MRPSLVARDLINLKYAMVMLRIIQQMETNMFTVVRIIKLALSEPSTDAISCVPTGMETP